MTPTQVQFSAPADEVAGTAGPSTDDPFESEVCAAVRSLIVQREAQERFEWGDATRARPEDGELGANRRGDARARPGGD
jgi:hypothetical protein